MVANPANLNPTSFLYIPEEYDQTQLVQQHLQSVMSHFTLITSITDLEDVLDTKQAQILIMVYDDEFDTLTTLLEEKDYPNLTKIVIIQSLPLPDLSYDFVFYHDEMLSHNLGQVLRFHSQQHNQQVQLEQHISKLEHQLSNEKRHSSQIEILKEAIVRNVSHELKTPLLHVKSAVSLIAEDMGSENTLIRYAENATARLETLVTNITMFGSSLDLNLGPVIVRDAVEYAHRNLRRIWESKEQAKRISLYIDDELPPVEADRQGLSTILQLLLDNALKFSDGDIEVHAHLLDDEIEISVKDYGIGIDPKYMNQIFESFYQIDASSTRRYGGTGVGLALVNLLIEKHNSQIKVDSEPDKGSTFAFRLKIIKL